MRTNNLKNKPNILRYAFWGITVLVVVFGIFITIEMVTSSAEISALEKKETEMTEKNRILTGEIIKYSSLIGYEKMAGSLGFAKPASVFYITKTEGVAAKLP